jgi:transposase
MPPGRCYGISSAAGAASATPEPTAATPASCCPWAATWLKLTVQIVKRPDDLHTFTVLPRCWVVERTLAWITSYRRCARDYERLPAHHEAMILWAMITLMTRRLARAS